MDRIGVLLG